MSGRSSHSRKVSTGGPTRKVFVRPSWIETQGNVGEFGSHGSLATPGSSLSSSKRKSRQLAPAPPARLSRR
jgi:hypothetical protein